MAGGGVEALRGLLRGRISVLAGSSGVGKSSLLNAVQEGLGLRVKEVSDATGKGLHTTRHVELIPLDGGGYVADTPGIRGLALFDLEPTEVDAYRYEELIADAFAFGHQLGDRFHLVAHDWGANIGWLMLATDPAPIASFTAISIPHYQVWARSVYEDQEMATYLSLLNIWMTEGDGEDFWTPEAMRNMWTAKPADQTEATIAHMMEPGAMPFDMKRMAYGGFEQLVSF